MSDAWPPHLLAFLLYATLMGFADNASNAILFEYYNDWLHYSSRWSTVLSSFVVVCIAVFSCVGALSADWKFGVRSRWLVTNHLMTNFLEMGVGSQAFRVLIFSSVLWWLSFGVVAVSAASLSMGDSIRSFIGLPAVFLMYTVGYGSWIPNLYALIGGMNLFYAVSGVGMRHLTWTFGLFG